MLIEVLGALLVGGLVVALVVTPLFRPEKTVALPPEPIAEEETASGMALLALKEIEFDRATGKLSESDYEMLKERYSREALSALAADAGVTGPEAVDPEDMIAARLNQLRSTHNVAGQVVPPCAICGPRPEPDALFCSSCGLPLHAPTFCTRCGTRLETGSRFCAACGVQVAAA